MHTLSLFCKTYRGDIERFKILKESIDKYNFDKLPFYVVCPRSDIEIFSTLKNGSENYEYQIISDEDVLGLAKNENHEQNWFSQQVIKLTFYKTGLCKHYLSLDSDCYFIKEFKTEDYIFNADTPYIPLTEPVKGAESNFVQLFRALDSKNEEQQWNTVSKNYIKREGKRFCLNVPPVLSANVLAHMEEYFLIPNNLTFKNLIEINPYEYEWYCDYLLKYKPIEYIVCTPFFVSFYNNTFYQLYRHLGFTERILANYYTGLIMHEGYIKDKKFKNSILGSIIRKFLIISYSFTRDKKCKRKFKNTKDKIKFYRRRYLKTPLKILFSKIKVV